MPRWRTLPRRPVHQVHWDEAADSVAACRRPEWHRLLHVGWPATDRVLDPCGHVVAGGAAVRHQVAGGPLERGPHLAGFGLDHSRPEHAVAIEDRRSSRHSPVGQNDRTSQTLQSFYEPGGNDTELPVVGRVDGEQLAHLAGPAVAPVDGEQVPLVGEELPCHPFAHHHGQGGR